MSRLMSLLFGGMTGTVCRYFISAAIGRSAGFSFPGGTLAVNAAGCLIVGVLASAVPGKWTLSENQRIFLVSGFCGAFTTFSALILETANLSMEGQAFKAFLNISLNLVGGFAAFYAGLCLGARL